MTRPSNDQLNFARRITSHLDERGIRERMVKLKMRNKGEGWPMYEALKIILEEKRK